MSLSAIIIAASAIVISLVLAVFYAMLRKNISELKAATEDNRPLAMLNQNVIGMQQRIDSTTDSLNQRLDRAAIVIQGVQREIGSMSEIGRSIKEFQEYLNSPKLRGNIGEHVLNDAIERSFSKDQYSLQFRFKEGQTVDALIKSAHGYIPVDSKFPMEDYRRLMKAESEDEKKMHKRNFERAVKKHIDDIAKKYILPEEGTVDFAVMYVPSESIYYEIVMRSEDLMNHARDRQIMLVSPNTFFHFLRVILMGLERANLAKESQRVWEMLRGVHHDAGKFSESLALVSKHITNAKNAMEGATNQYARLENKIEQVKLLK